ncbi:hypothetical protein FOL47_001636 [Perkinsus chesapeaki]|uniref:RAP domain-containing protein n=1 Tax=Perkinsus chesapeaki TaxID=330153 RepID=A0A7J6N1C7_PERCH|nr:hypothetical protein FOL47_001636 [Perkinsus chesapeaki]
MASTTTAALWQHARTCTTTVATGHGFAAISDPFKLRKILLDASRQKRKSGTSPRPGHLIGSLSDILAVCRRALVLSATSANSPSVKLQLLTTSLHRLVKHFYNSHAELVDSHCEELSKSLEPSEIAINDIADVLWSIGMAGAASPSRAALLSMMKPSVLGLLAGASPSQLSNVVCAIAKLDLDWSEEITESMAQCRDRLGIETTAAGVISNICWAAARTGCRDDAFLNDVAATWLSRDAKSVPPSATAMVFWSLGKLAPEASYVADLFSRARSHEGLFSGFGLRECTSALCGYAYSGKVIPSVELFKLAFGSLEAASQGHVSTQTIANCCWASATLVKHHGDQMMAPASCLTRALTETISNARIRSFNPQEASNVLWASAQLLDANHVASVASALLPANQQHLASYTPQDIAVCLAALTQAGVRGAFETFFVLPAMQKVHQTIHTWPSDSTHVHAVGQLAWSMAGRQFQAISPLLQWASSKAISSETFVKLLWATASTPEAQRGSLVTPPELLDLLDKRPEGTLNQQELALTLWSLATLRLSHQQLEEQCAIEAREILSSSGSSSITSGHLSMVMWGLASNSHRSAAAKELIQEIVEQVGSRRYRFTAADSHHVAWSLAASGVFDPAILELLLSAAATVDIDNTALQKVNQLALWASSHGFRPSPMVAHLLARASVAANMEATVADSIFQKQIAACLNAAVGSINTYRVSPELDLTSFGCPGVIVDLAVLRPSGAPQGEVALIVEADGPSHYINVVADKAVQGQVLDGKTMMRRAALKRLGFAVQDINISQWKSLSRSDRQELVDCMVKEQLDYGGKPPELSGCF